MFCCNHWHQRSWFGSVARLHSQQAHVLEKPIRDTSATMQPAHVTGCIAHSSRQLLVAYLLHKYIPVFQRGSKRYN